MPVAVDAWRTINVLVKGITLLRNEAPKPSLNDFLRVGDVRIPSCDGGGGSQIIDGPTDNINHQRSIFTSFTSSSFFIIVEKKEGIYIYDGKENK